MKFIVALLLNVICFNAIAQDDLFQLEKQPARKGVVLGVHGAFDVPGADLADRYGLSYRLGATVFYKFKSNWLIGPKADFILGNIIKEDSFLYNIKDKYGSFIGQNSQRVGVNIYQRGYMFGIQGGKILNFNSNNGDNGLMLLTGFGFMQHKIVIRDRDDVVASLTKEYLKGYDRLVTGWYVEQFVGYAYFGKNALVNFNIGVNCVIGFNKGRRDYLFDVMRPGTESRTDILFGIRGGWYIPIFKQKADDIFFE